MSCIEFDKDHFTVDGNIYDFGENGVYRIIRYDTGYYALQMQVITDEVLNWVTLCIAPQLDTHLQNGYDWKFSQGRLNMRTLIQHIKNSNKLANNELMELHLHLNKNLDDVVHDEIIKIIKSSDGDNILDHIHESLELQDSYVQERLKRESRYTWLLVILCTIAVIVICIGVFGI